MRFSLQLLALAAGAYAQSASYTDANSGITFSGKQDTTGLLFGMSLPETIGSDFIGQMVVPTITGYGGISLTGSMVGSLLVVAWPTAGEVVGSLRETSGYTSPTAYTNASVSLSTIANGTFVNSTHFSYTFLCSGCILGNAASFTGTAATTAIIGWGFTDTAPTNPSSASGATFVYHDGGFGEFGLALSGAQSADYATYASMATVSAPSNSTDSSSSTCSGSKSNITATVSDSTYDYIVAGAGPAGIIVAQRLAETGKSVLLLERGDDSTAATGGNATVSWNSTVTQYDVPSMAYYLTTAKVASEYCTDTADMAGCILGGGTMVNALMFVRPQAVDFDDKWPTGWKWDDVSAAADRLYERNPGTTLASKDGKRYDQAAYGTMSTFLNGLGYSQVDAIESPNEKTAVYSYPPWDIQNGLRAGPVTSYLPLAKALSNFELQINTKVVRVVRTGSTMTGVEVEAADGSRQIINLNSGGSVILSSGSMSTPRILFNSGIGPAEQITTVQNGCVSVTLPAESDWIDLPVGKNLKDHPIYSLTFNTSTTNSSMAATDFTDPSLTNIDLFAAQSGPLVQSGQRLNFWTSLNGTNGTRYFQGTCNSPSAGTVRIKLYLTHGATSEGVLAINSEGSTTFSTDPWMNTEDDKAAVIEMIDTILSAARNSTVMTPSDSTVTGTSLVTAGTYAQGSHFVGTAIMGTSNDGNSVVDTDTKVFGTDNLFVVDASIHPDLPTGNTQAIVMVVAEAAAAKIIAVGGSSSNSSTVVTTPSSATPASSTTVSSGASETSAAASASASAAFEDEYDC